MHQSLIPPRSSRKGSQGGAPCACWLSQISLRRLRGRTPDLDKFAFSLGKGSRFHLSLRNDDQLWGPSIPPRSSRVGGRASPRGHSRCRPGQIRRVGQIRATDLSCSVYQINVLDRASAHAHAPRTRDALDIYVF